MFVGRLQAMSLKCKGIDLSTEVAESLLGDHVSATTKGDTLFLYSTLNMKKSPRWAELVHVRYFLTDLLAATNGQRLLQKLWENQVTKFCQKHAKHISGDEACNAAYRVRVMLSHLFTVKRSSTKVPKRYSSTLQAMFDLVAVKPKDSTGGIDSDDQEDNEDQNLSAAGIHEISDKESECSYGPEALFPKRRRLLKKNDTSSSVEFLKYTPKDTSLVHVPSADEAPPEGEVSESELAALAADDDKSESIKFQQYRGITKKPAAAAASIKHKPAAAGIKHKPAAAGIKHRPAAAKKGHHEEEEPEEGGEEAEEDPEEGEEEEEDPEEETEKEELPATQEFPEEMPEHSPPEPPRDPIYYEAVDDKNKLKRLHSKAYHAAARLAREAGHLPEIIAIKARAAGSKAADEFREWFAGRDASDQVLKV